MPCSKRGKRAKKKQMKSQILFDNGPLPPQSYKIFPPLRPPLAAFRDQGDRHRVLFLILLLVVVHSAFIKLVVFCGKPLPSPSTGAKVL